ncbi:MAG: META domain-containing protein [Formosimonas sp.]
MLHKISGWGALLLAACATSAATVSLTQGEWQVVRLGAQATSVEIKPTLRFDGVHVSGLATCNRYSGEYVARQQALQMSRLLSTDRACSDAALMAQEGRLLAAFERTRRYRIDAQGFLYLLSEQGDELVQARRIGF